MGRQYTNWAVVLISLVMLCGSCGGNPTSARLVPVETPKGQPALPVTVASPHSSAATYSISGRTRTSNWEGIPNVTLTFSGGAGTATSDANGNYSKSGLSNGSYTITPSRTGWTFTPTSKTVNVSNGNLIGINFICTSTYTISGYVRKSDYSGISGVTVTFKQGSETIGTVTTNAGGWYQRSGFPNGMYNIAVALDGWWFSPVSKNVTVAGGSLNYINFYGSDSFTIAGRVRTEAWIGISGVTITLSEGAGSVTTDALGYYSKSGLSVGTYTVMPSLSGFTISPTSKTVTLSNANYYGINFLASARGDWWMSGREPMHQRRSPYTAAQTNNVKWSYTTGADVLSSAAMDKEGTVYFGSYDGNVYALNPNGSLKWAYTTGGIVDSSPAIGSDGTIYVGSRDNKLYAISRTGNLSWSYTMGGDVNSPPSIGADGTIYVCSEDYKLYAISVTGTLKWSYTTGGAIGSSPAIAPDGTVYTGSYDGFLYAVNPDGSLLWSYQIGNPCGAIRGADGTLYTGGGNSLVALNPNGTLKWSYATGNEVDCSPGIGADGTIYFGCRDNKLYALNPNGTLKWNYATGGQISWSSPAIGGDGAVYIGSDDSKVYALNPNGTLKWSYTTGGPVQSGPAIAADGTVYVGSNDNKLYAFGT